jgi:uncharacterized membrane protein
MSENPVQVFVAAFNSPDEAGEYMEALRQGRQEGLLGIIDAAVVVKDANGKIKITDAKQRRAKGFVTGSVVGGVIGLIVAPPVAALAAGGGIIGTLVGQLRGASLREEMKEIGAALTPNSSAIVAVIEHSWVAKLENALAAAGARVIRDSIRADIAEQLNAGRNVMYTAGVGAETAGVARAVSQDGETQVSVISVNPDDIFIDSAVITSETDHPEAAIATTSQPVSDQAETATPTNEAADTKQS